MKVLAFGEVLWDIYSNGEHIGGAPLNFAAHFKKCGGESWIITAIGNDSLGNKTVDEIKKMGINSEYITCSDKETGKCIVTLDGNQIPTYNILDNVAYDYIKKPNIDGNIFNVLYFGTLALRNENNKAVLRQIVSENNFGDVFVDMNIRSPYYSNDVLRFACENATIIKISEEELSVVMEFISDNELSVKENAQIIGKEFKKVKMVIITRGDKGAFVYDCTNKKSYECESQKVKVVSTVGAGDSFSAAFLAAYLKTYDIAKSLDFSTKISGYVVSRKEAIPDYDVKDFA